MKIVCVAYLHGSGGAERQIIMLANNLALQGEDVSLIVLVDYKSKYPINENVNIVDLTYCEKESGNKIVNRYRALKKAYKELSPQVTIHYWLQSAYLSAMMPRKMAGKVIYSERGDPGDSEYNGLLGIIRSIAFRRIQGFVFQSDGARDFFSDSIKKRATVIPNPISVPENEYTTPCMEREKKIVNIGRLHPQKNQALLIEAFSKLSSDFSEYSLEIYGDGDLREELLKKIKKLNLDNRVFLKGTTTNIYEKMYNASLFVLSSDFEGMPNALMEAMALGVPCVSTDCRPGGARALIHDGENGFIVPTGNVESLKCAMERALDYKELDKMCNLAQYIRKTHSEKSIFMRWKEYIHSL